MCVAPYERRRSGWSRSPSGATSRSTSISRRSPCSSWGTRRACGRSRTTCSTTPRSTRRREAGSTSGPARRASDAVLEVTDTRDRHRRRAPRPDLRALLPGGQGALALAGRHGPRPGDRQAPRRGPRRPGSRWRAPPAKGVVFRVRLPLAGGVASLLGIRARALRSTCGIREFTTRFPPLDAARVPIRSQSALRSEGPLRGEKTV